MASARVPTKATTRKFLTEKIVRFEFHLCERLGWGSVERMRREMSQDEFNHWRLLGLLEQAEQETRKR